MCEQFNTDETTVFLISTKAGGTGLNLTGADTVVHFDPWWNPAVEDQATDRAHRIGQTKKVHVVRLITRNTIEEKVADLQTHKRELIDAVVRTGEILPAGMGQEEILALFD
jgi:SNF2 family DNA or RNA helicase